MPIYHFLYYGYEKTVIDSQVITPALLLGKEGLAVHLIVMEDWSKRRLFSLPPFAKSLTAIALPRVPRNFLWLNTLMLLFFFLKHIFSREKIIVHARGLQGAAVLLPLKKIYRNLNIICDVRGVEADEYDYEARNGDRAKILSRFQTFWKAHLEKLTIKAISRSDRSFFVSQAMIEHVAKSIPNAKKMNWRYIPCSVQTERFEASLKKRDVLRTKMGLTGRVVVTYAGGNRAWQGVDQVAFLFERMKELNPKVLFLGLTREYDALRKAFLAHNVSVSDLLIETVPYDEIPNHMVCADIGILIRADLPLNNYACPTKFAEYLASGLHVVTTPSIHDIARIVRDENVGTILSDVKHYEAMRADLASALEKAQDGQRIPRSVNAAKKWLDWSVHLPKIKETYKELQ